MEFQEVFDQTIGRLDRALSLIIMWSGTIAKRRELEMKGEDNKDWAFPSLGELDEANAQTLKHHAEDMVGAGNKILKLLDPLNNEQEPLVQPKLEFEIPKVLAPVLTMDEADKAGKLLRQLWLGHGKLTDWSAEKHNQWNEVRDILLRAGIII